MKYDDPQDIWEGVTECVAHQPHTDQDCEHCQRELQERSGVIDQMVNDSGVLLKDLATNYQQQMPPTLPLEVKIDTLLDSIMRDPKDRLRYEGEVGRRIIMTMKRVRSQASAPTLHVPPHYRGAKGQKVVDLNPNKD